MSKQYSPDSWSQLAAGMGMLGLLGFVVFICLANKIGFGKALGATVLGVFLAAWLVVGVVLVVRGISKL